jgi:hypothetical protein
MTPPRTPKLSGAELAAQLEDTAFPKASPAPTPPSQTAKKTPGQRAGRPSKGGGPDALPVNVRLAPADHDALAKVAFDLKVPGRPVLTVQDVLRRLVRGALQDPATLTRLVKEGEV